MEKDETATIEIPIPTDELAEPSSSKGENTKYNENWYCYKLKQNSSA